MIESLVVAVGFFCGAAPLRTVEVPQVPGTVVRLEVPKGCPQPREPLFLGLRCSARECEGEITAGSEAGHEHSALATLSGAPGSLHVTFTSQEGAVLSLLRLSVAGRRQLEAELPRRTQVQAQIGAAKLAFAGDGPCGRWFGLGTDRVRVELIEERGARRIELRTDTGATLLSSPEGGEATSTCAALHLPCSGPVRVTGWADAKRQLVEDVATK